MIISDNGMVRLKGKTNEVLVDLVAAAHGLHEVLTKEIGKKQSEEMIMEAVKDAFKSEDELDAEIEEIENEKVDFDDTADIEYEGNDELTAELNKGGGIDE